MKLGEKRGCKGMSSQEFKGKGCWHHEGETSGKHRPEIFMGRPYKRTWVRSRKKVMRKSSEKSTTEGPRTKEEKGANRRPLLKSRWGVPRTGAPESKRGDRGLVTTARFSHRSLHKRPGRAKRKRGKEREGTGTSRTPIKELRDGKEVRRGQKDLKGEKTREEGRLPIIKEWRTKEAESPPTRPGSQEGSSGQAIFHLGGERQGSRKGVRTYTRQPHTECKASLSTSPRAERQKDERITSISGSGQI